MVSELLQQVRLLDPIANTDRVVDVLLVDGVIRAIEEHLTDWPEGTEVIAAQDQVLGPGLVDLYSHSGEPGFEERETLASLGQAALAGGFTRVVLLPDTQPAIDNPATVAWLRAQAIAPPHLHCWGALTLDVKGQQMTELVELAEAGVVGFADGRAITNPSLLRRLLEYLQPLGKPIALWPRDPALAGNGVLREGVQSLQFGLPGDPAISETAILAALLEYVAASETPVHLMRISTARSVELIRDAKHRGLPITASTTWMHLLLNTEVASSYDPNLHLDPPLGNPGDQAALLEGLRTGVLDAIAIDHSPYTYEEKTVAFSEAPAGAIGLELALSLLWRNLVELGNWQPLDLWRCLSAHPARCLGQSLTPIQSGQTAELTLFDPGRNWTVGPQTLKTRSTNTPWLGRELVGRVVKTWCHDRRH